MSKGILHNSSQEPETKYIGRVNLKIETLDWIKHIAAGMILPLLLGILLWTIQQ
mgnify:CR=1 FL=1